MTARQLRELLRQHAALPELRARDEFWSDFRARAALRPPQHPEAVAVGWLGWLNGVRLRLAVAALAVLVALCLVLDAWHGARPGASTSTVLSSVDEVDVLVNYGSLMILQDQENGGTVVWLTGVPTNGRDDG
jgi:hypothetical protein